VEAELAKSLAAAQKDLKAPKFDSQSMAFGGRPYKYASLAAVTAAARSALAAHGISILQPATTAEGRICVETVLIHASGAKWSTGTLSMPLPVKIQDIGGVLTYARRYSLCAALAIAAEDDLDGAEEPRRDPSPDELRERREAIRRRQGVETAIAGKKKADRLVIEGVVERTEERETKDGTVLMILLETGDVMWAKGDNYKGIAPGHRYTFDIEKKLRGMVVVDAREVGDEKH
jgi:hypothetical protein